MPRTRERLDSSFGAFQQQNDENFESRILVSKSRLKTASTTSALMAGFSLGAFVEVLINNVKEVTYFRYVVMKLGASHIADVLSAYTCVLSYRLMRSWPLKNSGHNLNVIVINQPLDSAVIFFSILLVLFVIVYDR